MYNCQYCRVCITCESSSCSFVSSLARKWRHHSNSLSVLHIVVESLELVTHSNLCGSAQPQLVGRDHLECVLALQVQRYFAPLSQAFPLEIQLCSILLVRQRESTAHSWSCASVIVRRPFYPCCYTEGTLRLCWYDYTLVVEVYIVVVGLSHCGLISFSSLVAGREPGLNLTGYYF